MGRHAFSIDWLVVISSILLVCLGLITILSIDRTFFYQQLFSVFIGIALFVIFSRIDFSIYHYIDRVIFAVCIIFLLLSYLGPNVRGATRWIDIGPIRFQPSEFVKPFYVLALSSFLIRWPPVKIKAILLHLVLFIATFLIVFKQPDLGSALVYVGMWVGMIIVAGIPLRYIVSSILIGVLLLPVGYRLLHDYQKLRIVTFLNPVHDPQGAGYNAIQSMISVGSGQLFGRGFGRGTQSQLQFLPERHTDFIFASFSEEFGFIGGSFLLVIFLVLLLAILRQGEKRRSNELAFLYICGFFLQLVTHVLINVGMNMGILPITGITLPLVSYGRSSLLATFIGLGLFTAALQRSKTEAL